MKKTILVAAVALLVAGSASADVSALKLKFKAGGFAKNTGSVIFGITATGEAPFGDVTIQYSKDGRTNWKTVTHNIALDDAGTATKRIKNVAGSYRAVTAENGNTVADVRSSKITEK